MWITSALPLSWTVYQLHVWNIENSKSWSQVWNRQVPCNCGDCRTVCHGCWPPGEFVSAKFVPPWLRNLCLWRPRCRQTLYFVKKASAGTEGVGQTQLCITTRLPAFFSLSSRFAVRTCWQTMHMFQIFPHFSIDWIEASRALGCSSSSKSWMLSRKLMTTQGSAGLRVKIPVPQHLNQCVPQNSSSWHLPSASNWWYAAAILDLCSNPVLSLCVCLLPPQFVLIRRRLEAFHARVVLSAFLLAHPPHHAWVRVEGWLCQEQFFPELAENLQYVAFKLNCMSTAQRARILCAARVGLKSGTVEGWLC